jgi:hypothetical protein
MVRFAAIALTSVLGVAGLASAAPAAAEPYVTVGVPVAYGPGPYMNARGPWYWHHDFYPRGFYRDHFHYHGYYRR